MIAWGAWRPDVAGPNSGFCVVADSVLPQTFGGGLGYGPFPALATASGAVALAGAPMGSIAVQKLDGSWQVYFASSAKIQLLTSTYGWTDIETGRTVTSGDDVSFAQFGNFLCNTDTTDGFKAYDIESGGTNSAVSGAPTARSIFTCGNRVVALSIGTSTRRLQWSGLGDHTNWTTAGADGKTLEDGGPLVGGRDLKNGVAVIFQEQAMRLLRLNGAGVTGKSIEKVANGKGAVSDRSIVAFDGMVFYLATDGFYKFSEAEGNRPIGAEKVNRWLADNLSSSEYVNVQGAVDPFNKVVMWRLSSTLLLGYDWQLDEFFTATATTSALTRIATASATIDSVTSTIDSNDIAIDSRTWQGGQPVFGALDGSYKFATFSGAASAATLRSAALMGAQSQRFWWATPVSDAAASTLAIGVSDSISSSLTFSTPASRNTEGAVPLDDRGRVYAFQEAIAAGEAWTFTNGIDNIEAVAGGVR